LAGGRAHRAARRRQRAALLALAGALAACSGGDEGGGTIKAWSDPERISYANGNVAAPAVAVDGSGNATAAFRDHDGTDWVLAANRYVPGNGWGSPQGISTTPSSPAIGAPRVYVATGPSGEVVVTWTQNQSEAWANTWTPGAGWGAPEVLDNIVNSAGGPTVALDASGAGAAVWLEPAPFPATDDTLQTRAYAPGVGWGMRTPIPLQQATEIRDLPVIAAQANGRAYVAWSQDINTGISLFAAWTDGTPPSAWNTELVDTLSPPARNPDLAVTASGTAFLVWDQAVNAGEPLKIWARRRPDSNALGAWEAPIRLDVDTGGDAQNARVAVDDSGNAVVVWEQTDTMRFSVWANRYVAGSGWGAPQLLETADDEAVKPQIAMNPGGEAFAVWTRNEGGHPRVWAAHFVLGEGWGTPVRLENDTPKNAFTPTVAVDGSGNAFAVWGLSDPANSGVSKIWASQYR